MSYKVVYIQPFKTITDCLSKTSSSPTSISLPIAILFQVLCVKLAVLTVFKPCSLLDTRLLLDFITRCCPILVRINSVLLVFLGFYTCSWNYWLWSTVCLINRSILSEFLDFRKLGFLIEVLGFFDLRDCLAYVLLKEIGFWTLGLVWQSWFIWT